MGASRKSLDSVVDAGTSARSSDHPCDAIEDLRLASELDVIDGDLDGFICAEGVDSVFAAERLCLSASIASIEYLSAMRTAELLGEVPTIL